LAEGGSIDKHDNSLAYAETAADSPPDGQFKVAWATGGRTVTVSGSCPACGGLTATGFSPGIGGSKGLRARIPRPQGLPSPVTLFCECGHAHTDRPPDALDKGCGRFWLVFLPDDARQPPLARVANTQDAPDVQAAP
jgi:hypothetical protein